MHTIPAYTPSVTLFTNDGQARAFDTYAAALKELGIRWIRANVGEHFHQFDGIERLLGPTGCWERNPTYRNAYAIMRNDAGAIVTAADFDGLVATTRRTYWWMRGFTTWNGKGPVPMSGNRRRRGGHHQRRRIKSTQERRLAQLVDREEPAPRAARSANNIPNSWDEYGIAAREDRSWKNFRRQQWKAPRD